MDQAFSQCVIPTPLQSFPAKYASKAPEGFTVRIWYKLDSQSGSTVVLENVNNFKITKSF